MRSTKRIKGKPLVNRENEICLVSFLVFFSSIFQILGKRTSSLQVKLQNSGGTRYASVAISAAAMRYFKVLSTGFAIRNDSAASNATGQAASESRKERGEFDA
jgi:hypothetical protein